MDFNDRAPRGNGGGNGNGNGNGDGGRRRRRRRRRRGGRGRTGGQQQGGQNAKQQNTLLPPFDPEDDRFKVLNKDKGTPSGPEELTPFNLFCAYHLGVTRNNGFKFQSVGEVARRFGMNVNGIKNKLWEFGIDAETLAKLGFEAQYAQLDIKVAPEGVSRVEIGRTIWAEFEDQIEAREPVEPEVEEVAEEAAEEVEEVEEAAAEAADDSDDSETDEADEMVAEADDAEADDDEDEEEA